MHAKSAALRLKVESALAGRVGSPFRLRDMAPPPTARAGIDALDEVMGGLPRGCLTEIHGPVSSGKTSLLQSALASRTADSEACALVDAQDSFDPGSAESAGVRLGQLLWIRCRNLDQAFRSADLLLHGGGFGLVALDLSDAPARLVRQVPLNVWFRLRRTVENTSTILLVLSRESNAKSCASLVLRMAKEATSWSLRERQRKSSRIHSPACLLDGWAVDTEVVRSRARPTNLHSIDRSAASGNDGERLRFEVRSSQQIPADSPPAAVLFPAKKERTESPG